jgi:PadR family transcriptional regulator, regulatory protein PadR
MPAPTELVKGNAALLILSCLAREPMHGYRIVKTLDAMSEGYFNMREGTLYPHLHELERDGLIEGSWENVTGNRERRVYRITSKGTGELARMRQEWATFQLSLNRIVGEAGGA